MAHNLTKEELADMHMVYGAAHGNPKEAVRLYQQRFPNRYLSNLFRGVSCALNLEAVTSNNYCKLNNVLSYVMLNFPLIITSCFEIPYKYSKSP